MLCRHFEHCNKVTSILNNMNSAAILIAVVLVGYATACENDGDCAVNECCLNPIIKPPSEKRGIFAKRGAMLPMDPFEWECTERADIGGPCYSYTECACKEGLQCQFGGLQPFHSPTLKRMIMIGTCQPI